MANRMSEIAKLKADIEEMSNRLMALTADAGDELEDIALSARMRERWQQAKEASDRARERVQEYAEENPWQMLATGAIAGFLLGYIMKNRKE